MPELGFVLRQVRRPHGGGLAFCPTCEFPRTVATAPPSDTRQAAALGAIMTFTQAPHPAPCGTDACLLCLIESTAKDALRVGE